MKKILMLIFVCIFLIGTVMAEELTTFDNVKNYDELTKTVTIVNTFDLGRDISTIQLLTPLDNKVGLGYQKVAEFEIELFDDTYTDAFEKMEFYDLNNDWNEINRQFDYKYKTIELVDINDYGEICSLNKINGTTDCNYEIVGTHKEEKEVWLDFDTKILIKGKVIIGIFTDVHVGDKVEWIPTLFGKEIDEWAIWTADLNTDLYLYFALEESSGAVVDGVAGLNTTTTGTQGATGKVGNCIALNGNTIGSATYKPYTASINAGSINYWIKTTDTAFDSFTQDGTGEVNNVDTAIGAGVSVSSPYCSGTDKFCMSINRVVTVETTKAQLIDGDWHMVTITVDGTTHRMYIDGLNVDNATTGDNIFGGASGNFGFFFGLANFVGSVDEVGIWNRSLTSAEVTQLYNGGDGITYTTIFGSVVSLNSPIDYFNSSITSITFNGTITVLAPTNVSLIIDDVYIETNTSGVLGDYLFTDTLSSGSHTWNYETCGFGTCNNATARTIYIDTTNPIVNIVYPTNATYVDSYTTSNNKTIQLNWSASDTNLDTCWYYNTTDNVSVTCNTNSTIYLPYDTHTFFVYANDTSGREISDSVTATWNYLILENSIHYNSQSYETKEETFTVNITTNGSATTSAEFFYNDISQGASTKTGTDTNANFSNTIQIPLGNGNKEFYWKITLGATEEDSTKTNQTVNETVFTYCNATYTTPFLNVSFKDESDDAVINATIPTSNFIYYLGDGTVTKTYTYVNSSDLNYYYQFCATPNLIFHTDPYIQYKQGADYPQRIYDAEVLNYTNTTTDLTLYLLGTADGIYVTFQIINTANQVISGVEVTAVREISGTDVQVGIGTTGADGGVTLWLNPDFSHDFTFTKSGFDTYETSFPPTQSAYTITLSGGVATTDSYFKGIDYSLIPVDTSLVNDTTYTFGFNLTSSFWDLTEYGFNLRLKNGTIITGDTTTTSGTSLTLNFNTLNQTKIYLDYYWLINETYTNGTKLWLVYNTEYTQWSIATFFTDLDTYLDSGFFGIDDFGRYLIIFIIIFFTIGIMSFKFGFTSPLNISVMTFLIVFFFDVVIGIIPPLSLFSGTEVEYLLTFLTGLIATIVIFNEVKR